MTRRRSIAGPLLLALAILAIPACSPASDTPAATALSGGTIVVGDGGVIRNGTVVFSGGVITAVGPSGEVPIPVGAEVVALEGRTVLPGLVDAHAHLGYEGYTGWGADHYTPENVVSHLERYAYYGFSAVFSAGSDPADVALAIREGQDAGTIGGARLVFAAGMAPPGQGPNAQFLVHTQAVEERTGEPVVYGIASPEEARAAVADVASLGIPFLKIWVDDRGGSQEKLAPDLYRAILAAADDAGLQVVAHQQAVADMPGLLDAGVAGFLHGRLGPALDEAMAEGIAGAGAFLVPNLSLGELRGAAVGADPFFADAVPPAVATRLGGGGEYEARPLDPGRESELRDAFLRLRDAGVDIVLGTDAGAVPDHFFGYTGHRELEIFVRLGMSPLEAITAATSVPAERLGLDDLGLIEPGRRADLVVLDADPLQDIRNTRSIAEVYHRGIRLDRGAMLSRLRSEP